MSWRSEFGDDYDVPAVLEALVTEGSARDASWHNDSAPSFDAPLDRQDEEPVRRLRVWIEHPDPTMREMADKRHRFVITLYDDVTWDSHNAWSGDDPAEAAGRFRRVLRRLSPGPSTSTPHSWDSMVEAADLA